MTVTTVGPREKALYCSSLAPLIHGLISRQVVVEMKNGIIIYGTLECVDCFMNLTLTGVKMVKSDGATSRSFDNFFLHAKNLRYIRIPDDVDIMKTLTEEIDIATGKKAKEMRQKEREKRANRLRKKEQQNLLRDDL